MKTIYKIITAGIVILSTVFVLVVLNNPFSEEEYHVEIIGLKDQYQTGEKYSFYYVISGYGYPCASYEASYPDENGDIIKMRSHVACAEKQHMSEFEINHLERKGTLGNTEIQKPGTYTVTVTFEKPSSFFPTTASKTFEVLE